MNVSESFITDFIEVLDNQGKKKFMLSFKFRGNLFKDNKQYHLTPRVIHLLIDATSNYKGVWIASKPFPNTIWEITDSDWKMTCYHDSCWGSDGMRWIFQNFHEMREELREMVNDPAISIYEINDAISFSPDLTFYRDVKFDKKRQEDAYTFAIENFMIVHP